MKKSTRILAVSLALCLGLGTAALAAGGTRTIEVLTGMKVLVNGEEFTPTDVNGNAVDVFAYNGTTYVPIRAISEAFGKQASFDAATQSIHSSFLRLAYFLLANWDSSENSLVRLSQQELAYAVNSSRASISRACRLLKQEGIIATEGVGFRLLDREGLRRLCERVPQ